MEFLGFVNSERAVSPTPCDVGKCIRSKVARIILTDTTIYCDQPAILTQPVVCVSRIAPAFLRVVNVNRASEHEEVLGVDHDPIPCGEFDFLGEGSRLWIAPVEIEDLEFQFAFHRRTFPNPPPRNPAMTLVASCRSALRGIAERSITIPRLIAWCESEKASAK